MRAVNLQGIPGGTVPEKVQWLTRAVNDIATASKENDPVIIAQNFRIIGDYTPLRTFDVATATLDDIRRVVATFLSDLQKGGANRSV